MARAAAISLKKWCVKIKADPSKYIVHETYCEDGEPVIMIKINKCINIMY